MPAAISVVIPTYRRPEMLARVLAALAPQAAAEGAEVLVTDNCPDRSAEAVARAAGARWTHEPVPGVSNARNRGVAEASGDWIAFLDDDETPRPGWLAALRRHAEAGAEACFGRVEPAFETPPPAELAGLLDGIFSRRLDAPVGADVSDRRAWLGAGNSLFRRGRCFPDEAPFDPRFNAGGGEDIWLLRRLVEERGVRLIWAGDAVVDEHVPAARMTAAYVRARKFNSGRLRCVVESGARGPAAAARVALWMGVGLAQAGLHGAAWAALSAAGAPRARAEAARAAGGLGKLLWWRAPA